MEPENIEEERKRMMREGLAKYKVIMSRYPLDTSLSATKLLSGHCKPYLQVRFYSNYIKVLYKL